jgi:hypothetical protein
VKAVLGHETHTNILPHKRAAEDYVPQRKYKNEPTEAASTKARRSEQRRAEAVRGERKEQWR